MSKTYNVKTTTRAARPRSKRLREAGIASVTITGGGSSSGGSSGGASGDGHTHTNLPALETLSIDTNNYLYMRQYREGAVDETTGEQAEGEFATEKAKSGYADDAAHAAEADHATNADQWEEHAFGDYLDQPMRTTDTVRHEQVITEAVTTPDFTSGFGGAGAGLTRDANGNAVLELDKLVVRRSMSVSELVINQITHVGGRQIFSAAGMTVTNVEVVDGAYRCYFDTKDGNVANLFEPYDQAYCQRYSADNTNVIKYYWRLVTAIGTDYIDLSMSDYDGDGVPEEGDQIAQIGNRYYTSRQSMLEIDQLSGGKLVQYAGINSYSFSQKNYLAFGVDPDTGGGYFYVYGDLFVGDRDLTDPSATYMTFQTRAGETRPRLVISADIKIGAGSSGLSNLSEWSDKQQQIDNAQNTANDANTSAANAQNTANGASTSAEEAKQIAEQLNAAMATLQDVLLPDLQAQIDGAITSYEGDEIPTATNAPAVEWTTDAERARHLNDYYDRWITAADGTKSVTRYKYTKEGSAYTWVQIADNGAAEALSSARTALGLAGTKCAVTYSATAPEVPYVVNDMWIKPDNSIYLCVVGRGESEVGLASDWTLINNAQAQLDAMAADCTFTRQEKARLRNTWAQITAEYNGYIDEVDLADPQGINDAYNALNAFLTGVIKIGEDINTPIEVAQRTQYNNLFAAWYKAVSDYTKALADASAAEKISDIEWLAQVFGKPTIDSEGAILSKLVAVKDDNGRLVAGMDSGTLVKDATHGRLMIFAGATSISAVATAATRIYEDGTIATKKLAANGGTIGGFTIGENWLKAEGETYELNMSAAALYINCDNGEYKNGVYMSSYPTPSLGSINHVAVDVRVNRLTASDYNYYNTGLYLSVEGQYTTRTTALYGNLAIYAAKGTTAGWRPFSRPISASTTLTDMDCVIPVWTGNGNVTLTLPNNPQPNQRYEIRKISTANSLYIISNNKPIYWQDGNNEVYTSGRLGKRRMIYLQYMLGVGSTDGAWIEWESYVS